MMKEIFPDKLLLLITGIIISSFLVGIVILFSRLRIGEWFGFVFGTIIYLGAIYAFSFRGQPKENKPRKFKLLMLILAIAIVMSSTFGLFYFKIIPLEGYGEGLFYTFGAIGLAMATDYFLNVLFSQIQRRKHRH